MAWMIHVKVSAHSMHDSLFVRVSCLPYVPEVCLTSDKHGMSSRHDMKTCRTILCQLWTRNYGSANDQVCESSDISPVKECLIVIRYVTHLLAGTKFTSGDKGKDSFLNDITRMTREPSDITRREPSMRTGENYGETRTRNEDWIETSIPIIKWTQTSNANSNQHTKPNSPI